MPRKHRGRSGKKGGLSPSPSGIDGDASTDITPFEVTSLGEVVTEQPIFSEPHSKVAAANEAKPNEPSINGGGTPDLPIPASLLNLLNSDIPKTESTVSVMQDSKPTSENSKPDDGKTGGRNKQNKDQKKPDAKQNDMPKQQNKGGKREQNKDESSKIEQHKNLKKDAEPNTKELESAANKEKHEAKDGSQQKDCVKGQPNQGKTTIPNVKQTEKSGEQNQLKAQPQQIKTGKHDKNQPKCDPQKSKEVEPTKEELLHIVDPPKNDEKKVESQKGKSKTPEPSKDHTNKQDSSRPELKKQEPIKQEPKKSQSNEESKKPDTSRRENKKQESSKQAHELAHGLNNQESTKDGVMKPEQEEKKHTGTSKEEVTKPEPPKKAEKKSDSLKQEVKKAETTKSEKKKTESPKQEAKKDQSHKEEVKKLEPLKQDIRNDEPSAEVAKKSELSNQEAKKSEKNELPKEEGKKPKSPKQEKKKAEPSTGVSKNPESPKQEVKKTEQIKEKCESTKQEPNKTEYSKDDCKKPKPVNQDETKSEVSKEDAKKLDSPKQEAKKIEHQEGKSPKVENKQSVPLKEEPKKTQHHKEGGNKYELPEEGSKQPEVLNQDTKINETKEIKPLKQDVKKSNFYKEEGVKPEFLQQEDKKGENAKGELNRSGPPRQEPKSPVSPHQEPERPVPPHQESKKDTNKQDEIAKEETKKTELPKEAIKKPESPQQEVKNLEFPKKDVTKGGHVKEEAKKPESKSQEIDKSESSKDAAVKAGSPKQESQIPNSIPPLTVPPYLAICAKPSSNLEDVSLATKQPEQLKTVTSLALSNKSENKPAGPHQEQTRKTETKPTMSPKPTVHSKPDFKQVEQNKSSLVHAVPAMAGAPEVPSTIETRYSEQPRPILNQPDPSKTEPKSSIEAGKPLTYAKVAETPKPEEKPKPSEGEQKKPDQVIVPQQSVVASSTPVLPLSSKHEPSKDSRIETPALSKEGEGLKDNGKTMKGKGDGKTSEALSPPVGAPLGIPPASEQAIQPDECQPEEGVNVQELTEHVMNILNEGGTDQHDLLKKNVELQQFIVKLIHLLKEKTDLCSNLDRQNSALTSQAKSLKDVIAITKDLLNMRNMEIDRLHGDLNMMDNSIKEERTRHNSAVQHLSEAMGLNDKLKVEYHTQMDLFEKLKDKYTEKVVLLTRENMRMKLLLEQHGINPSATPEGLPPHVPDNSSDQSESVDK